MKPLTDARSKAVRHWGGFLLAGGLAFLTDAALLEALTRLAGVPPLVARLVGIPTAMIVSWLVNRRVTFAVHSPPSIGEFLRFAGVSWLAAALNYAVFAGLLVLSPGIRPVVALVIASLAAMVFSYLGFRLGVFRSR